MRILAVDDEPIFLGILEVALNEQGFDDVAHAYSAQEALRELEFGREAFDCILLDIRMPGIDGIELCRRIRALPRYHQVPIMMVTAMADRIFIEQAFTAGATDYLTKPLDEVELKARMFVMQRLVAEQLRNQILEYRAVSAEDKAGLRFELSDAVHVQGFDRVVEYLALENYLLSLGVKEVFNVSAFAISIKNASALFSSGSRVTFMNMLCDIASCIEDALKHSDGMVAYAGGGKFVVVANGKGRIDTRLIEDIINLGIENFNGIYLADRMPMPKVKVGPEVHKTLFSRIRPTQLLHRALLAVEPPAGIAAHVFTRSA